MLPGPQGATLQLAQRELSALPSPLARCLILAGPTHLSLRRDAAKEGRALASLQAPTLVMLFWDKLQRYSKWKGSGPHLQSPFPISIHCPPPPDTHPHLSGGRAEKLSLPHRVARSS